MISQWSACLPGQQVRSSGTSIQGRRPDGEPHEQGIRQLSHGMALADALMALAGGRRECGWPEGPSVPTGCCNAWVPNSAQPHCPLCRGGPEHPQETSSLPRAAWGLGRRGRRGTCHTQARAQWGSGLTGAQRTVGSWRAQRPRRLGKNTSQPQ